MKVISLSSKRRKIRFQQAMTVLLVLWALVAVVSIVGVERRLKQHDTVVEVKK